MKYNIGDEVLVKGSIVKIECEEYDACPVAVGFDKGRSEWYAEEELIPADKTYSQGLADAWELAKKLVLSKEKGGYSATEVGEIFGMSVFQILERLSVEEAIAKIEAYKREKEIKVGSIVKVTDEGGEGIVTAICTTRIAYVLWKDGSCGDYELSELEATGRTAEGLADLLRQIKE